MSAPTRARKSRKATVKICKKNVTSDSNHDPKDSEVRYYILIDMQGLFTNMS